MIQRIQSLYLLIASLLSIVVTLFVYLWKNDLGREFYVLDLFEGNSFGLMSIPILFAVSGLMSLLSIFLYTKRQRQFVINRLNILTNLILLGVLLYQLLTLSGETAVSEKGIGVVLPVIVIVLLVMANKAIKKDEDLVKSVDRLR